MTRRFFLLAVTALAAVSPTNGRCQSTEKNLDAYMSARESLGQFSGAVLVSRNGRIILAKGYGYADIAKKTRNTPDTRFRAASITKQFTAMAILQLREAGRLSLDDSICRWIDRCPEAWKPVTIAHLIHHSSGIPDYEEALELGSDRYAQFTREAHNADMILDSARLKPLDFPAGSKFHYSNTGYILLAQIIEKASVMKFAEYMKKKIFEPVGMQSTGIFLSGDDVPRQATGYEGAAEPPPLTRSVAGIPFLQSGARPVPRIDMSGIHGDGGMYTTVTDLNKWADALFSERVIPRRLLDEYMTPGLGNRDSVAADGYAFGWIIDKSEGMRTQYHTGLVPGFVSRIERYPDSGVVVIVMSNAEFFRVSRIARDLAAVTMGRPYDVPRSHRVVALDSAAARASLGKYVLETGDTATVSLGDKYVEVAIPGRFTAGLLPESASRYYVPFFEGTVEFPRNTSGSLDRLVMHYNGRDRVGRRITTQ